jgi:hypothetical protein
MNKTQKIAWFNLTGMLLMFLSLGYVFFHLFILKRTPQGFVAKYWPLLAFAVLITFSLYLIQKKQSPKEVKTDERDKLIDNRAAMAAFVSAWIVLPAVSVIPRLILGDNGCVPAWSLPLINIGALFVVMTVYSAAILVQYVSGRNNGNK